MTEHRIDTGSPEMFSVELRERKCRNSNAVDRYWSIVDRKGFVCASIHVSMPAAQVRIKEYCRTLNDYVEDQMTASDHLKMMKLISRYRNGIGHRECKDLTGHPDAMPSQRKDWRCSLCKQADKYTQPPQTKLTTSNIV